MQEPMSTSLGSLSDHDWQIIRHRWARGIDWNVQKVGKRHWEIVGRIGQGFPLFRTKKAAYDIGDELVRREALHRHWREHFGTEN